MNGTSRNLLERMTEAERDQSFPDSEPRDSATLMLIDRSGAQPKVLFGRRHHSHKFLPGKFVFPGGSIEAIDREMTAASELHADAQKKLMQRAKEATPSFARGFPLAAIRETAEETGLLLGLKRDRTPPVPGPLWSMFADAKIFPDLAQLHFIARAITPPRRPRRFDTRFFTADASHVAHKIGGVAGPDSELVELTWMPIEQAAQIDLPTITALILEELLDRIDAGMAHDLPVPFYFTENEKFFRELL